ncbi:hypothetical protein BU26DRAFT_520962 [Trematosphaeria pertusa]|uniref:Uncharacterized protein n=1 Tax=Trematosphaeria pertusa TaxID=390896 RepID=A0A6A6I805_9PLEO|nr:uncharacterized protein BU26DRAFT_520962 [Trematosphaeria pertusa]KAF2246501.1 hypothetical protein BU26DRAFT_520962 [Trematosphaeria pertusa]
MASIFRDFSFESARTAEPAAVSVCPTSIAPAPPPARLPTPPPCSVGDLAHALTQQSLRVQVDPSCRFACEPLTPPSDELAFPAELLDRPQQLASQRLASATLRMQRQANTKMQCTSSRIKDISLLVRMIEERDQCRICEPKSSTPPSPPLSDEDEGVDMEYTPSDPKDALRFELPFWRAGEKPNNNGCARVSKGVRMRKRSTVPRRVPK